jgi:TetR/AcrR family transcriptional regulator
MQKRNRALGRRTQSEAIASKRRIAVAARGLFARRGFDAVSLRDIALKAGTTHGLVRHHFGSKLGVWRAVVDSAEEEFNSALLSSIPGSIGRDATENARHFIKTFVRVSSKHSDFTRLVMQEGAQPGRRLSYILKHLAQAHGRFESFVGQMHAKEKLLQFTSETLFHFLLFAVAAPFAMPQLSHGISADSDVEHHAERIARTLL